MHASAVKIANSNFEVPPSSKFTQLPANSSCLSVTVKTHTNLVKKVDICFFFSCLLTSCDLSLDSLGRPSAGDGSFVEEVKWHPYKYFIPTHVISRFRTALSEMETY